MAEESAPLRRLLEKNVQWHWSEEHTKSLNTLKTLLTKAPVLKYYAINEPLPVRRCELGRIRSSIAPKSTTSCLCLQATH